MDEMRTWKVKPKSGYVYFKDPNDPKRREYVKDDGPTFQATREEVKPQLYKLIDVTPGREALKDKLPKKRGRKPKETTSMSDPPAERTMNAESLFDPG